MSRSIFQPEWRTQSRRKRRFYARYMGWLEKTGFVVVGLLVAGFAFSFFYEVEEWVSAEDVEIVAEETVVQRSYLIRTEDLLGFTQQVPNGTVVKERDILFSKLAEGSEPVQVIQAPVAGVFFADAEPTNLQIAGDVRFGVIRNYGTLLVKPKLAGKSIANAAVGQPAELTNIRIQSEGDTLLRAHLEGAAEGQEVSRQLAGGAVKKALEDALVGKSVKAREDKPLKIVGIGDVEVEAEVLTRADGGGAAKFDPPASYKLHGIVSEGKPVISAQLGDLPPDVRESAIQALRAQLVGKAVMANGKPVQIENVLDPRFVVRLSAEGIGESGYVISAASVKRTFDATVRLQNVPADLVERIRQAHLAGKAVTAKVQVRTGSRPIAYFLLRRS